ncbi:MAG: biotin/lipoyl-containing protein, partial [Planctomycetota bacterium]
MHIIRYPVKGRFSSEGVVTAWDKSEGDPVKKGDFLVQIEAPGELMEVESAADGALLKMLAGMGRVVRSGDPLAVIGKAGEDFSKAIKQLEQDKSAPAEQGPKASPKLQSKPAVEAQTIQATQSKKEEVMTTPKSTGSSG